jgi:hypothetical protein
MRLRIYLLSIFTVVVNGDAFKCKTDVNVTDDALMHVKAS